MLTGATRMRGTLLIAVLVGSGCATPARTMTTIPTRRIAFTTLPRPFAGIQGTSGVALSANFLPGNPASLRSDGAVAFPLFQPDFGAVVKVGKGTYLGGRVSVGSPELGVQAPAGSLAPQPQALAFDFTLGGGHDFRFTDQFGLSVSGELGIISTAVTRLGSSLSTQTVGLPVGRGTVGLFYTPGKVRLYAGGTVGTSVLNDGAGTMTTTCQFDCFVTETGRVDLTMMGMIGGGIRYQFNEHLSMTAEAWLPLTEIQRMPPVLSLAIRVGDFGNSAPPPKPLSPPPPPPQVMPEPEQAPVPL